MNARLPPSTADTLRLGQTPVVDALLKAQSLADSIILLAGQIGEAGDPTTFSLAEAIVACASQIGAAAGEALGVDHHD